MKILHTADWHISTKHTRYNNLYRALERMLDEAMRDQVDLILVAGDIMELSPRDEDLDAVAHWLQRYAGIAPTVVVAGNHDPAGYMRGVLQRIGSEFHLYISTVPESLALYDGEMLDLTRLPPGEAEAVDVVVHTLPYPHKGQLLSMLPELPAPEQSDQIVQALLREIIGGFRIDREKAGYTGPSVLLGHVEVSGSVMDSGQPNAAPGLTVSHHDLELSDCPVIALGHIHARQSWDARTYYCGSPARLTWGEAGTNSKGYNLIEFLRDPDGQSATWYDWQVEERDLPSPRLWTVEAEWRGEAGCPEYDNQNDGAPCWLYDLEKGAAPASLRDLPGPDDELRYRYHVPEEQREIAQMALEGELERIWPGPRENVTVEPRIIPSTHARAPEIATEEDPVEQGLRYLRMERPDLTEDQLQELLPLLQEAVQGVSP